MEVANLPIPFLRLLKHFLNSYDLINLFIAVYDTNQPDKISNSALYNLLFDQKYFVFSVKLYLPC